ncbi:deoxyribodipyrimidine photo-lyase [Neisseria sp. N95_16]|uniref:Deoxyribodipyrimidine photo-lyase n=1 Tax=Neisseria brasiliensis TaxID=2666100 RepID=A0A5Q3RY34_9NEIS|nr:MULTISPECIES: deoxyribodipyrimidine photo-lyase [Neisseria]MRN37987.1 deoxyribodipyrimidine photo-lyase [Neisseria brasiliensis]PJO10842.1 deoxyribodipyrimidine photo-lyase [Neisseria sp. N95_16]PJO78974.1 deoxyribodipyrimidine photo-lyase [Neisseria sp. N177_16]QGL24927.1 deoxyribodipyrimidine photo-lyase [Neisseria brasiliensis]
MQKITLIWFRRNLRLSDNAVLQHAVMRGLPLTAAYVLQRPSESVNPRQAAFHHQAAAELSAALAEKGVPLFAVQGDVAEAMLDLATRLNAQYVLVDEAYTPSEIERDNRIWRLLDAQGIAFERFNDRTVFAKADIMSEHGRPYLEFAPYKQAWLHAFAQQFTEQRPSEQPKIPFQTAFADLPPFPEMEPIALMQQGGEQAAWRQWQQFAPQLGVYPLLKDFPAKKATSQLGAYLSAGCISPRMLAVEAAARGAHDWLENLIRRDFYQQWMFHHPEAAQQMDDDIAVNADFFRRWTQGETGFPLIDAAMRCLQRSGWLPPVLRRVVAQFWCVTLQQPWQHGARWFAQNQLDDDAAVNLGNWQTAAGLLSLHTPRVPHPTVAAQQFDPDGTFIRRHLPELAHLPKDVIHAPWLARADVDRHGYPLPMVEI